MRLFFAAPLEPAARAAVAGLIEKLAASGADYKWVETGNLHLTLAFLGETPEDRLPQLKAALEEATRGKAAFTIEFDHLGAFDSLKHPRVLWLGASEGEERLAEIAKLLIPPQETRAFKAHLTLGRQRSLKNLNRLQDTIGALGDIRIESRVDRIELIRSRLSSADPSYESVAKAPLA